MSERNPSLTQLGWSHFFQRQLCLEDWETTVPVRVFAINRHLVEGVSAVGRIQLTLPVAWLTAPVKDLPTVGDWVLVDGHGQPLRVLERTSLFKRMASGRDVRVQLMAANVETLFIVSSCNQEFNLSRLERYLALALDARVTPVVVLTKADTVKCVEEYVAPARGLHAGLAVVAVNARAAETAHCLAPWCQTGQTVALVGSSGVGKSTLVNTLCAGDVQATGEVRETDAKGRHTTTGRSLHLMPGGGLLLDSPGLRELQLSDCEEGVASLFEEIETVARSCRFNDCRHQGETGCAVAVAVAQGRLEPRRLENYLKLRSEQERTEETLIEKRRREKSFGRMSRRVLAEKRRRQD